MSNKRCLIIVTLEKSYIYINFKDKYSSPDMNCNTIKYLQKTLNCGDKIYVLAGGDKKDTTNCLLKILGSLSNYDIIICYHKDYIDTSGLSHKMVEFSHSDEVGNKLLSFAKKELAFDNLWNYLEKKSRNYLVAQILHLFLPLDIDMQAIAYLQNKKKTKEIIDYLTKEPGSSEPVGMLRDKIDYEGKFTEALQKINEMQELKNKEAVIRHLKKQEEFLKTLNQMSGTIEGSKVEDAIKKYLEDKNFWKNVESFHDWYCALAECLRGEKACEGE